MIKIIECPRDAMQGMSAFVATELKIKYLQSLLNIGFDTIDCGSFVSAQAVPQMQDTNIVLQNIDKKNTNSKLLTIVVNTRGAIEACNFDVIDYLGFPFSISETFQMRNANKTIETSFETLIEINKIAKDFNKKVVAYISMAFGNPYGDLWNEQIVLSWSKKIIDSGIDIISISDTIGVANKDTIYSVFDTLIPKYKEIEFGAHLHTHLHNWEEKIMAANKAGCNRFDGAIKGYGGCPFAQDKLVGNMPTENLISFFRDEIDINMQSFIESMSIANKIFI